MMSKTELMERLKKAVEKKAAERKEAVEKFKASIEKLQQR